MNGPSSGKSSLLQHVAAERSFRERVRRLLGRSLAGGEVSLAALARTLHLSPSTLKRRLAAEGVTYTAILDELRHSVALRDIGDPERSVSEVAVLSGYEDPNKRWTDRSPVEHRPGARPARIRTAKGSGGRR